MHTSLNGALARLDSWLDRSGLERDEAHGGEVSIDTFVGNKVDPMNNGGVLEWGINKMRLHP